MRVQLSEEGTFCPSSSLGEMGATSVPVPGGAPSHGAVEKSAPVRVSAVACIQGKQAAAGAVGGPEGLSLIQGAHSGSQAGSQPVSWAGRVAGDQSIQRNMKLKFVQPVHEDGVPRVSSSISVMEEGAKDWALCLVGHFLDTKLPFPVVKSIVSKLWAKDGLMDVLPKGYGVFFFRFS